MSRFDMLTKYIPLIKEDNIGEWIVDTENDGTPQHPKHWPYVCYSETVLEFIRDFYRFVDYNHKEY